MANKKQIDKDKLKKYERAKKLHAARQRKYKENLSEEKLEEKRRKDRERYHAHKADKKIKLVNDMTDKELLFLFQNVDKVPSNADEGFKYEYLSHNEITDDPSVLVGEDNVTEMGEDNGTEMVNEMDMLKGQSVEDYISQIHKDELPNARKKTPLKTIKDIDNRSENTTEDVTEEDNCICHNLKLIVQKLQLVSDKLISDSLCDSYDEFSKYISSLLRGLPKKKALELKKNLVSEIIEALLVHERGDQDTSSAETTPKRSTNKQCFNKTSITTRTRQFHSDDANSSKKSTEVSSRQFLVSGQNSTTAPFKQPVYQPFSIPSSAGSSNDLFVHPPATITQCESIRTVKSTADGTLVAITLPSRGTVTDAEVPRSPHPLVLTGLRKRVLKRKKDSEGCDSKRPAAETQSADDLSEPNEVSSLLRQDCAETEVDIEDSKELVGMKFDEESMDENFTMVAVVKQEVEDTLDEDNEDTTELFVCDICLTHCPSKKELIQHIQQEHSETVGNRNLVLENQEDDQRRDDFVNVTEQNTLDNGIIHPLEEDETNSKTEGVPMEGAEFVDSLRRRLNISNLIASELNRHDQKL